MGICLSYGSAVHHKVQGYLARLPIRFLTLVWLVPASALPSQRMEPHLLGAPAWTAEHRFSSVAAVRELPDGTLLVADPLENRILIIDPTGSGVRDLSREGRGPGEHVRIGTILALSGDSTLITDAYSFRWSVYSGTELAYSLPETRETNRRLRADLLGVDADGRVLSLIELNSPKTALVHRNSADSLVVVRGAIRSERIDTIAIVRGRGGGIAVTGGAGGRPGQVVIGGTIAAEDRALLARDGAVGVVRLDPYRVDWLAPSGIWTRGPPLPFSRQPLTRAAACFLLTRRWEGARCPPSLTSLPHAPAFVSPIPTAPEPTILLDESGQLVVARALPEGGAAQHYDVVARDGRLRAVVSVGTNRMIAGFGRRGVYVVEHTEDGLRTLTRHSWPVRP